MRHRALFLWTMLIAATLAWSLGWGRNSGHVFGDPLLAREMMYAGRNFAEHGLATWGLPVYRPGAPPYTHLTPGPEWIQALFAAVRIADVDRDRWHSVLTALLSLACIAWLAQSVRRMATAMTGVDASGGDAAWTGALLVAATPAFLIYAPHPYCAGTLLGNAITFAAAASWAAAPDAQRWRGALVRFALALAAAFWLGIAPVVSGGIWTLAAAVRFGDAAMRRRRMASFFAVAAAVAVLCVAVKLAQSVAVLGSLDAAMLDVRSILSRRAAMVRAPGGLQQQLAVRAVYLFGLALPLIAWLGWRSRDFVRREWPLLGAIVAGGLAWQVVMRQHAVAHVYMLREAMVPLAFLVALFCVRDARARGVAYATAVAGAVLVIAALIVPLIVAGEPLWRLR